MQNVFMHVGMPKAGSTSIQLSLQDYDDGTTRYARMGSACHSARVMFAFVSDPEESGFLRRRDLDPERIARVRARCVGNIEREVALGRDALVISGEAIGSLRAPDIAAMDAFFTARGCRLTVFAYIREPVGFASSSFQQGVKAERETFDLRSCRPGFRQRYQDFIDVLAPGQIRFLDFRRENLRGGSVVPDFAAAVGVDMGRVTEVRANESLSAGAVALLYFWNREREALPWGPENNIARSLMAKALSHHFAGKFRLSPSAFRSLVDDDDIAWMERAAGFPLRIDLDRTAADDDPEAIGSEADLAAARDAALPDLARLLDRLEIERPRKETAFLMMRRLFRHFHREARREVRRRKSARGGGLEEVD
jgi:hypothetical protein